MFQEEEPGKPQNWCFTVTVIITISLINVAIFVFLRVLLDSENEFDEPIIQGKLRQDLTQFLGIFALTFCFGCWCCFCCTGNCFKCFLYLNPKKWKFGKWWANLLGHHFAQRTVVRMQTLRRKQEKEEHLDLDDFPVNLPKNHHRKVTLASKPSMAITECDFDDIDRKISPNHSSVSNSSMIDDQTVERRPRPTSLAPSGKKPCRHEQEKFSAERIRRWSVAPVSADVLVKMSSLAGGRGSRRDGGREGSGKETRKTEVAIRGVDFVQIPVQMLTPSTVAIIDARRGMVNQAYDGAEDGHPKLAEMEEIDEGAKREDTK